MLFVVLGSSLAMFDAGGIVVFVLVVGLAICLHNVKSLSWLAYLALVVLWLMCLIGLLLTAVNAAREVGHRDECFMRLKQIALAVLV